MNANTIRKAEILQVGVVENGRAADWIFDGKGAVPGIEIRGSQTYYGGYTIEELDEISMAYLVERYGGGLLALIKEFEIVGEKFGIIEGVGDEPTN
ncbi:MAG: hypothetical protein GY832_26300 [Chloroflexi bacterium]|nr:hypothetical protein [Chloroflexota bacterium]